MYKNLKHERFLKAFKVDSKKNFLRLDFQMHILFQSLRILQTTAGILLFSQNTTQKTNVYTAMLIAELMHFLLEPQK